MCHGVKCRCYRWTWWVQKNIIHCCEICHLLTDQWIGVSSSLFAIHWQHTWSYLGIILRFLPHMGDKLHQFEYNLVWTLTSPCQNVYLWCWGWVWKFYLILEYAHPLLDFTVHVRLTVVEVLVIIRYSALAVRSGYTGNVVVLRVACTKWWSHLFVEVAWIQ